MAEAYIFVFDSAGEKLLFPHTNISTHEAAIAHMDEFWDKLPEGAESFSIEVDGTVQLYPVWKFASHRYLRLDLFECGWTVASVRDAEVGLTPLCQAT